MKKKLNTSSVLSELAQESVFFKKSPTLDETSETHPETARTENRSEKRPVRLPIKRRKKRNSFEFYEDQLDEIKKIKIETELDGASISQSEIVREAIDFYFKTVRKSERSENRTE